MTYATEEMAKVLHSTLPEGRFHEGFWELQNATRTGGVELEFANRLWGQRGYSFLSEFLEARRSGFPPLAGWGKIQG